MKSWISPKTKKGLISKIHGVGLFATENIKKDEIIAIRAGHLLTKEQMDKLPFGGHSEIQISDDIFLCPITIKEREEVMIFINHSCDPNVGMRGDIVFVAMRDIESGEELFLDYAMVDNQDYKMNCNCNSLNCRKIVTGNDFKLPELKKYGKYFSAYIQSKQEKI